MQLLVKFKSWPPMDISYKVNINYNMVNKESDWLKNKAL